MNYLVTHKLRDDFKNFIILHFYDGSDAEVHFRMLFVKNNALRIEEYDPDEWEHALTLIGRSVKRIDVHFNDDLYAYNLGEIYADYDPDSLVIPSFRRT